MGITDTAVSTFFSLITGDAFSSTIGPTEKAKKEIKKILDRRDLNGLLDEYHQWFVEKHDPEISSYNVDMLPMRTQRRELLESFDKFYQDKNIDISSIRKEQFFQEAFQIVVKDIPVSEIGKKYLNGFFQIVLSKKMKNITPEIISALNYYSDQVNTRLKEQDQKISENKKEIDKIKKEKTDNADLNSYYDYVLKSFTEPNNEKSADLVGEEADETAYIDAYITVDSEPKEFLEYLEEWFENRKHRVILVYGEPGHGKSTLCKKATVEYLRGNLLKNKAKNVLTVSLNTGYNPDIIKDGALKISNALVWGADREHRFSFEDCRESLLFMDGFDEFIDVAKKSIRDIDIVSFIDRIDEVARQYDIHVVVLSRTIAVQEHLKERTMLERSFLLLPVTEAQQDNWLDRHKEYDNYRKTFITIREHQNMGELLGIPLLFRLIVHNRFSKVSPNTVDLYNNLFAHLMDKRGIRGTKRESVLNGLMNLAYDIYCTDTNLAVMKKEDWNADWIFAFYLRILRTARGGSQCEYKVGFYHRTFYQYFLAKYIYLSLFKVTEENVENFIGDFGERELDDTVREYLSSMLQETDKEEIYARMAMVIDALVKTEAFCNLVPRNAEGNAEKSKIGRVTNCYRNIMHIAFSLSYVIQIPFKDNLDLLIRSFQSVRIRIKSNKDKRADLKGIQLRFTDLREVDLSGADLRKADLSRADLNGANLRGVDLSGADLGEADLSGADLGEANLSEAKLSRADLGGADLSEAKLSRADLRGANLRGASLRGADLSRADLVGAYMGRAHLDRAYLNRAYLFRVDLRGANLSRASLSEAYLSGADLSGTDLSEADLRRTDLLGADLCGANLSRANLRGADLSRANLKGAGLRGADLGGVKLYYMKNIGFATIDTKYKKQICSEIYGYSSINWVDQEKHI